MTTLVPDSAQPVTRLTGHTVTVDQPIASTSFTAPAGDVWHIIGRDLFLNKVYYRMTRRDTNDERQTTHVREIDLIKWRDAELCTITPSV